jgi:hypothetical protein
MAPPLYKLPPKMQEPCTPVIGYIVHIRHNTNNTTLICTQL